MSTKKKKSRSEKAQKKSDSEPYAIVSGCDGCGAFVLNGVVPLGRSKYSIYNFVARCLEGVRDGFVGSGDRDIFARMFEEDNMAVRLTLAEALVLFVEPVVARTKNMPPDAIPVIRWWQKQRRPTSAVRCETLVQPLLSDDQLAKIARHTTMNTLETFILDANDEMQAMHQELLDHRDKFEEHFLSSPYLRSTWFLSEADLQEIGVTARSRDWVNPFGLKDQWAKCPRLVQRTVLMAAHMRLIHTLAGNTETAALWSKEVKTMAEDCLFVDSGQVWCLVNNTQLVLDQVMNTRRFFGNWNARKCFTKTPQAEKECCLVLRAAGSWLSYWIGTTGQLPDGLVYRDFCDEAAAFIATHGVEAVFRNLEQEIHGFDAYANEDLSNKLASIILLPFFSMRYFQHAIEKRDSRFFLRTDPPKDLYEDISRVVREDEKVSSHCEVVAQSLSKAFWEVACMIVHPELFDYPAELGGRGVRKHTPPSLSASSLKLPSFTEATAVLVEALFCMNGWSRRFAETRREILTQCLTVAVPSSEVNGVQRTLCPEYFIFEQGRITPSETFLQHASRGGDQNYVSAAFRVMATRVPATTVKVLEGMAQLRDKLSLEDRLNKIKLENDRKTSTTKTAKQHCAGCGLKEDPNRKKLMSCSRCKQVRYCSAECQRKHWRVHKKVCSEQVGA